MVPPASKVLLKGFWQAADYIPGRLEPSWDLVEGHTDIQARLNLTSSEQRSKTAFLHVRLGDFCILPHHQVNLLAYYVRAMERFPSDTRFLVFSDTQDIAKSYGIFKDRCVFVDEPREYSTLYIMSLCHAGAITANSTFSWWGAYFGRQSALDSACSDYLACMPSRWMAGQPGQPETTSAIYPNWATIVPCDPLP